MQIPLLRQGQGGPGQEEQQDERLRLHQFPGPHGLHQGHAGDERKVCRLQTHQAEEVQLEGSEHRDGATEAESQTADGIQMVVVGSR